MVTCFSPFFNNRPHIFVKISKSKKGTGVPTPKEVDKCQQSRFVRTV